MKTRNILLRYWEEKPLVVILLASSFFRLLSVIFSKGYGMSDDHFLVIEPAQKWVDVIHNDWFPTDYNDITKPTGHPLLYTGLHYLLFKGLQAIGIYEPQTKMYIVRFIHAVYSLTIVYFGYKIAERLSNINTAKTVGLLLGLLWFMPIMSVRNLIEFVCIPPLLYATWLFIKTDGKKRSIGYFWMGILLGIGFNIRFQTFTFLAGFGLSMLILKRWKESLLTLLGFLICIALVQAFTDIIIWKKPFTELSEYIRYNIENANNYITQSWYMYLMLIGGILIPPISLFIMFGFIRIWKKYLILFLPAFLFFLFHSIFPNKQERFILPAIPFIIIGGYIGWTEYKEKSVFWLKNLKLLKGFWIFFWIINFVPLCVVSVAYSKKSRVESMVYLSHKKDLKEIVIEESIRDDYTLPPLFYLDKMGFFYYVTKNNGVDNLIARLKGVDFKHHPSYVVFNQPDNIDERVKNLKKAFPNLTYEATIEPGFIDKLLHDLNPHNANYTCYIYKTNEEEPKTK